MGDLSRSESVLLEALHNQPNHHFPLYGFGRTLLVQGRYAEAADALTQALDAGAPPVVLLDVGEALYRMGSPQEAVERLRAVPATDEPHRTLMAAYLLNRLGVADRPDADMIRAGLPYWLSTAERYPHTAYGQTLSGDVQAMLTYLEEV
jgi:tetratricopeptide (TPR) repeat protein